MDDFIYDSYPLSNRVADYLIKWINEHGLQPGDKIPTELELTQILGMGRSSVREALTILKSRNIVEVRRGCGTFLCQAPGAVEDPLGLNFVKDRAKLAMDWGTVRLIIEPAIAELAAIHATEEDIQRITYWDNRVDQDIANADAHLKSDIEFHRALSDACNNVVISKLMPIIIEGIQQFMSATNNSSSQLARSLHHRIRDAISAHDAAEAKQAMQELLCVNQALLRQEETDQETPEP
ncbi:MAG: FadR family transcriptional regulator [Oscillibacter sp.]|nr:FadR family transcriptional regulator [Oscillibacter sp.]MCI9001602.1 FadR family transcriptional regulator [Oscillibacter sp.]